MTPDGPSLVVISSDGTGSVWPISLDAWKSHARAVAGRSLTREDWSRFVSGKELLRHLSWLPARRMNSLSE
jgi:hypothetical protein